MSAYAIETEIGPDLVAQRGYPVRVDFPETQRRSRFYAFPLVGWLIKMLMLIPFFIANCFVTLAVGVLMCVTWIPVLVSGQYPNVALRWYGGHVRWMVRVYSFLYGITDKYPEFNFDDNPAAEFTSVNFGTNRHASRLFALPVVGMALKCVLLIPHLIMMMILGMLTGLSMVVVWFPVLMGGRYPHWALGLVAGTVRYMARVQSFLYGLTDTYPPFSLS
jgi:hypothetical protein